MLKLDYNPCTRRYQEWLSQFSQEQQKKIADLGDDVNNVSKLIKLKRDRKPVEVSVGDVFWVSNKEGLYFYGKIVRSVNTNHPQFNWSKICFVVFIFKCITKEKNLDNYSPNYNDCVCGPAIFDVSYWEKGYLEIIENIPLTKEEKKLDIGFFDSSSKNAGTFVNSKGKIMRHCPKFYDVLGFKTSWGISHKLSVTYITDPMLFE